MQLELYVQLGCVDSYSRFYFDTSLLHRTDQKYISLIFLLHPVLNKINFVNLTA